MNDKSLNIIIRAQDNASHVMAGVGDKMESMGKKFAVAAKVAAVAAGAMAVAFTVNAVNSAADYEQSLNVFKSVSGATAAQMKMVGDRAKELGNDIALPGISAKDSAFAMVELSKAGLSVNDTLAASKGVLALAKAGQLDTAEAARIAANALNAFSLDGSQATRVADLLASAANASSADVKDLALGMQMASSSAAAVKVPVEDLTALLAEMANNGISGSDAGTSLKTMFMNLIPTTDKAKSSMAALNADFYDAKGNFVGVRDLIDQLQKGTAKLTDEQKAQHIENIFGADSSRAANILIKEGVVGYDEMTKALGKNGAALALAAAQNKGFKGAMDNLKSTFETLSIEIGTKMLPVLTKVTTWIASNVQPAFSELMTIIKPIAEGFMNTATAVGDYLLPKFQALWTTIREELVPMLLDLWHNVIEPLLPVLGVLLVGAIGLVVDVAKLFIEAAGWLYDKIKEGNPIIIGLTGLFGTLAAAMAFNAIFNALSVGFATLQLITIPSVMASIGALHALILTPIIMPAIAVAAALAAIAIVFNAVRNANQAIQEMNKSKDINAKMSRDIKAQADKRYAAGEITRAKRDEFYSIANKAKGGSVSANQPYFVGENSDGSLNNTSELFIPRTSGQIINSKSLQAALKGGSGTTFNMYGNVILGDSSAVDSYFDRINAQKEMGALGVGL